MDFLLLNTKESLLFDVQSLYLCVEDYLSGARKAILTNNINQMIFESNVSLLKLTTILLDRYSNSLNFNSKNIQPDFTKTLLQYICIYWEYIYIQII